MAPVVLAELLSDPRLPLPAERTLLAIPMLGITTGFWQRAGKLRASLIHRGYRPKVPDALIAQCCIDNDVPLITRHRDFRPFVRHGGLRLI